MQVYSRLDGPDALVTDQAPCHFHQLWLLLWSNRGKQSVHNEAGLSHPIIQDSLGGPDQRRSQRFRRVS